MKEIFDYEQLKAEIITSISVFQQKAEALRKEVEVNFKDYTYDEIHQFIAITREIRETIFRCIDTHILTIEHIVDKEACQRRAKERNEKTTKSTGSSVNSGFQKVPVKSKMEQLFELMNKATPEQLEQVLKNVKK